MCFFCFVSGCTDFWAERLQTSLTNGARYTTTLLPTPVN
eukprot:COSAG06_NODE_33256_length_492_cov_143.282443_1_plen_38_part_10